MKNVPYKYQAKVRATFVSGFGKFVKEESSKVSVHERTKQLEFYDFHKWLPMGFRGNLTVYPSS